MVIQSSLMLLSSFTAIKGERIFTTTHFEKISQKNRYGYGRISSKEQARNSSLESQKAELIKLGIPEENIYLEIGSATDVIENRPIFF